MQATRHPPSNSDPARPLPGREMPSRRNIDQEIARRNLSLCRVLKSDSQAFLLAHRFLSDFDFTPLAQHLESMVEDGKVVFGPFSGFLAANVAHDDCEWIVLSTRYADYVLDEQIAASLVHEIGALRYFAPMFLDHVENERRERLFLDVQRAHERMRSLIQRWHRRGGLFSGSDIPVFLEDRGPMDATINIDSQLAHHFEFRHQTANAIVVLPDERVVLLHRATHAQSEPSTLSIIGGHLHAGWSFLDTILHHELPEELGMRPGYEMEGLLVAAIPPGNWHWEGPKNREYRALYVYFASEREQNLVLARKEELEAKKKGMEEWRFEWWLANMESANRGYYESQGIHVARLADLVGSGLRINEAFADAERNEAFVRFSADLLLPIVHDPVLMDSIRSIVDCRADLNRLMSRIRGYFSKQRYNDAAVLVDEADALVGSLLKHGTHPGNGLLRTLFRIGVYRKVLNGHANMFLAGGTRSVLQVILVDPSREEVILQRRGPYKRLFPGSLTVSASCRWPGAQGWREAAAKAVLDEVGIRIDPSRLEIFEAGRARHGFLASYTFEALSEEEAKALMHEAQSPEHSARLSRTQLNYDTTKACLDFFTIDPAVDVDDALDPWAIEVSRRTGVPLMFPVFERKEHHLSIYRLNETETARIHEAIHSSELCRPAVLAAGETGVDPDRYRRALKDLDSDTLVPLHWQVLQDALRGGTGAPFAPTDFALDMAPVFLGDQQFYSSLNLSTLLLIGIDHSAARLVSITGGKGSNLHILCTLAATYPNDVAVPRAEVVTVASYEENVLGQTEIRKAINALDEEANEPARKRIAKAIRGLIAAIEIRPPLLLAIEESCSRLGPDTLMVRSSATVEDLKDVAAAGHGRSFPAQGTADVAQKVKEVWASLFTPEFVELRWRLKDRPGFRNADARMAVVLQRAVRPLASGVVTSVEAGGRRPIFTITARPGFGGTVVDGLGEVDKWQVGLLADVILERKIGSKDHIQDFDAAGGLTERLSVSTKPSLSDADVLAVARACRHILIYYRKHDLAENIDVEFAVSEDHRVHIVQARSEQVTGGGQTSDGKQFVRIRMVDIGQLPAGVRPIAPQQQALCACAGVATAPLQVIEGEMHFELAKNEVILVTHHTNNSWNDVFTHLKGIITEDGGETSHAAKNARALGIPCIVGWTGAVDALSQMHEKVVTIDSFNRSLYQGSVASCEVDVSLDLWLAHEAEIREADERVKRHEIARRWQENKDERPEIFLARFDGHWRRRSSRIPRFQLDCYDQAWNRLTARLNEKYRSRAAWTLEPQLRQVVDSCLLQLVPACDDRSIYDFLATIEGASIEDALELYDERSRAFNEAGAYFDRLPAINAQNVQEVVDQFVDILSWMHFAYWLNALVGERWLRPQLKYLATSSHELLRDAVLRHEDRREFTDISREKDAAIQVIVEELRVQPALAGAFAADTKPEVALGILHSEAPLIAKEIEALSLRYKIGSEDISALSDTNHYLLAIRQFLADGTLMHERPLRRLFRDYLEKRHNTSTPDAVANLKIDPVRIRCDDPSLYTLLSSYTRGRPSNRSDKPGTQGLSPAGEIRSDTMIMGLPELIHKLLRATAEEIALEENIWKAVEPFPILRRTLLASRLETTLREDGHHLIVRMQRALAPHMIEVGKQFFRDANGVFDLSAREFVSLVKTGTNQRIEQVADHWAVMGQMEVRLADHWTRDPAGALQMFEDEIGHFLDKSERLCTGDIDLEEQLVEERARLAERIKHLRSVLRVTQHRDTATNSPA